MPAPQQAMLMVSGTSGPSGVSLLANYSQYAYKPYPTAAAAYWTLSLINGYIYTSANNDPATAKNQWLPDGADANDYEIQFTITGGSFFTGSFGTWIDLGVGSVVPIGVRSTSGTVFGQATAVIRDKATQTPQTSGDIYLEADCS